MDKQKTCEERIKEHYESRIQDLRWLYGDPDEISDEDRKEIAKAYGVEPDDIDEDWVYDERANYGLSFDYVEPGTFTDQDEGYWRYQISWGGPSEEFRFYASPAHGGWKPYKIQFWFLDWFDGAHINLVGKDRELLEQIFHDFDEMGMVESEIRKAIN